MRFEDGATVTATVVVGFGFAVVVAVDVVEVLGVLGTRVVVLCGDVVLAGSVDVESEVVVLVVAGGLVPNVVAVEVLGAADESAPAPSSAMDPSSEPSAAPRSTIAISVEPTATRTRDLARVECHRSMIGTR